MSDLLVGVIPYILGFVTIVVWLYVKGRSIREEHEND